MAWSIFSDGGGDGAAVTWAQDLEKQLGVPQSGANTQFIYDWEKAEGGGGKYNPLNQGPVPGRPDLTTTGQQYGGGAADFASWQAGIEGAAAYLNMPAYAGIKQGLQQSDYGTSKNALVASPWAASHYNGGANFPDTPAPGAGQLASGGGSVTGSSGGGSALSFLTNPAGWFGNFISATEKPVADLLERGALIVFGAILIIVGVMRVTSGSNTLKLQKTESPKSSNSTGKQDSEVAGVAEEAGEAAAL